MRSDTGLRAKRKSELLKLSDDALARRMAAPYLDLAAKRRTQNALLAEYVPVEALLGHTLWDVAHRLALNGKWQDAGVVYRACILLDRRAPKARSGSGSDARRVHAQRLRLSNEIRASHRRTAVFSAAADVLDSHDDADRLARVDTALAKAIRERLTERAGSLPWREHLAPDLMAVAEAAQLSVRQIRAILARARKEHPPR